MLSLMCRNGTETAAPKTSPVGVYRELYHLICRDMLPLIARMGQFCVGKIIIGIQFLNRWKRIRAVHTYIFVSCLLHQLLAHHPVCFNFNNVEVLHKCLLVFQTFFIRVEEYPVGRLLWFLITYPGNLLQLVLVCPIAIFYMSGYIYYGPLPHSVNEIVCLALHKYGRKKPVLPIVVMGKPAERCLYTSYYNRYVGI